MGSDSPLKAQFLNPASRWSIILATAIALLTSGVGVYKLYQQANRAPDPTPPPVSTPVRRVVTALGRLEPQGEVIKLSAANSLEGSRVAQLLVKQGDKVQPEQVIAILDSRDRLQASLEQAKKQVQVAQANLAQVKAGAKTGEINAQQAEIARLQAQLIGEQKTQQAEIARLQAQLIGERKTQQAAIARLQAQLLGERQTQQATISRLQAQLRNAEAEFKRYEMLYRQGAVQASTFDSKRLTLETTREQLNEAQANLNKTVEIVQQQIQEAQANLSKTVEIVQQQIQEAQANRDRTANTLQEQIRQAKATLNQISEVRPTDVQAAQAQVESALAAVKKAQADLNLAYVRSPLPGQILKINTRPGEVVSNNGVVELGQTDQMVVVAEIYESDISQVRLGQPATITSETSAFTGELQGTVNQIGLQIGKRDILNTDPAADVDARVIEAKILLNPEASSQVSGLTNSKVVVKIDLDSAQ